MVVKEVTRDKYHHGEHHGEDQGVWLFPSAIYFTHAKLLRIEDEMRKTQSIVPNTQCQSMSSIISLAKSV